MEVSLKPSRSVLKVARGRRPQLICSFDLSQGQPALRHHVPEASELRPQGAGAAARGERPTEQRFVDLI